MKSKGRVRAGALICLITLGIGACRSSNNSSGGPAKTYLVKPEEVSAQGCLNMEKFFGKVRDFPANTSGRLVTQDVQVGQGDTIDSEQKRLFTLMVSKSAFTFEERPASEIFDYTSAQQGDCKTTKLIDADGASESFDIKAASGNSLTMQRADGLSYSFTLLSPQSMEITKSYAATDICSEDLSAIHGQVTRLARWGGADIAQISQESVSSETLRQVAKAITTVPAGIQSIIASDTVGNTGVAVVDLKQLATSEMKTEVLACYPTAAIRAASHGAPGPVAGSDNTIPADPSAPVPDSSPNAPAPSPSPAH